MRKYTTKSFLWKAFPFLLTLWTLWNVSSVIISHWSTYTTFRYWQDFPGLKKAYLDSQYVNKHPKGWIPDEGVNSYAGGAYMQGISPHLIAPDTPPLGRYLIGVSALLLNNANEVVLLSAVVSLVLLYILGMQIFKDSFLALLPVALFSSEKIFQNQLIYTPLLDIMQLVFLLASFIFFNKGLMKRSFIYFLLASFFIGCFIATKFFITGLTIIGAMGCVLLLHRYFKKLSLFVLGTPLSILILLLTYVRAFAYGYHLREFLGIQKWVFLYHKSQLILPFSIWPLLFLNKWYVWFGNSPIISDPQWSILWPFIAGISIVTVIFYVLRKIQHNRPLEVLLVWIVLYILFFSFGQITTRYFVIYIPVLYVIAIYGLWRLSLFMYTRYNK